MLQKTKGIVLHTLNYSEASVIAHIYTEQYGIQSFLLNGVRKPKAKFNANLLQPLSCVEIVAYIKPHKNLHRVSECIASPQFNSIPYDTVKTTVALFLAEVVYRTIREEEKNKPLFDFIYHAVLFFDHQREHYHLFHLLFMLQLTRYLGFYPRYNNTLSTAFFDLREGIYTDKLPTHTSVINQKVSASLLKLMEAKPETLNAITISAAERKQLLKHLVHYFELHQPQGFHLQSLQVLEEVLS